LASLGSGIWWASCAVSLSGALLLRLQLLPLPCFLPFSSWLSLLAWLAWMGRRRPVLLRWHLLRPLALIQPCCLMDHPLPLCSLRPWAFWDRVSTLSQTRASLVEGRVLSHWVLQRSCFCTGQSDWSNEKRMQQLDGIALLKVDCKVSTYPRVACCLGGMLKHNCGR
jgi:hypothetical protein